MNKEELLGVRDRLNDLRAFSEHTENQFCEAFAVSIAALQMTDNQVAQLFQISRPTVGRWARGDTAPHPIGRKIAIEALHTVVCYELVKLK
jgi:predicted XRE-type DNA-binding protein